MTTCSPSGTDICLRLPLTSKANVKSATRNGLLGEAANSMRDAALEIGPRPPAGHGEVSGPL